MQLPIANQKRAFVALTAVLVFAGLAQASVVTNIQYANNFSYYCLSSATTGPCAPLTSSVALTNGSSTSGSLNYAVNLGDGDNYILKGTFSGSYSEALGSSFIDNVALMYVGASPSAASDTVVVDLTEAIYDSAPGSYNGTYSEDTSLCATTGFVGGSSVQAQYFVNGAALPLLGPYSGGAGCANYQASQNLSGLTNPLLILDWEYTFNVAAGTAPGASIGSITPEPAESLPLALALGVVAFVILGKKRNVEVG